MNDFAYDSLPPEGNEKAPAIPGYQWPLVMRAITAFVLRRHAAADGTVLLQSKSLIGDMSELLCMHPSERPLIRETLTRMVMAGWIERDGRGRVYLTEAAKIGLVYRRPEGGTNAD